MNLHTALERVGRGDGDLQTAQPALANGLGHFHQPAGIAHANDGDRAFGDDSIKNFFAGNGFLSILHSMILHSLQLCMCCSRA